jgi:hypothetical protein
MNAERPIIRRLDHVVLRTDDPRGLFSLLAGVLRLPVVWDVTEYDFFVSGGVFAGNVYLEAVSFGLRQDARRRQPSRAEIWGLAFEPFSLRESLDELAERGLPHSPPFYSIGTRLDREQGLAWTNVTLGGLLSDNWKSFYLGRRLGGNSPFSLLLGKLFSKLLTLRWAGALVSRAMNDPTIYLCEYTHDNESLMATACEELERRRGGALGIRCVKEVTLGVTRIEEKQASWQNLLSPIKPIAPATWKVLDGPALRLVSASENRIESLVLRVSSLPEAKAFLAAKGMLGEVSGEHVCLNPSKAQGLDVRFVE